ncbi:MAG: IS1634 family transposase [Deltaproteobacteria bacterium]|jgi:transposase|nr:IS1634 family transposase [Deltaproteobacteria bacterium]
MGHIISKKIDGSTYYYYVESKSINGKPRNVNQTYLGTAAKILEKANKRANGPNNSLQNLALYSVEYDYGMVTLLHDLAKRLNLVGLIDSFVPQRRQGASVGTYILTAAINMVVAPTSTSELEDWCQKTYLPCLTDLKATDFTAQNFWNKAKKIDEETLEAIEDEITSKILRFYNNIDVSNIIYDATNLFTYIDPKPESDLTKRGPYKSKRNDLRLDGLSLMVSPDYSIPLIHENYPGNMNDAKGFVYMVERLKYRFKALTGGKDTSVTMVFDPGSDSEENIKTLISGDNPFHYVGGLKKGQAPELWAIPKEDYLPLQGAGFAGQSAYRLMIEVFGHRATGLIVHNPKLEAGQLQGIRHNINKTRIKLTELHERLMKRARGETVKGKKPTIDSLNKSVDDILKIKYMKDIFECDIFEKDNNIYLNFCASDSALERIRHDILGKTVFFTDRADFSNEEIIGVYRSARPIERAFRQMKDTKRLTTGPMFHWTDQMVKIHLFTCVLAYRMGCLLVKELTEQGLPISINELIEKMSEVKKIETFFGDPDNPKKVQTYTLGSEFAQQALSLYQLPQKYF